MMHSLESDTPNHDSNHGRWVEIEFDCLPLRTVARVDVPLDASPKLAEKMLRVKAAIEKHGALNSYYLHNAACVYHLTNDPTHGMLRFEFEGVLLTDERDMEARSCDLHITLASETCSWINQAVVDWLTETVQHAVQVEFNRYIGTGDLNKTIARIEKIQASAEASGGFVGMYL